MELLHVFKNRLNNQKPKSPCECENMQYRIKKSRSYYLEEIKYITDKVATENVVILATQRKLSHIGIGTISRYNSQINAYSDMNAADPSSTAPLLLSLAMVEPQGNDSGVIYRFVLDLRQTALIQVLPDFLQLPVTFVCHHAKELLFCIWQLRLDCPDRIWDTAIFEKASDLGKYNKKYFISQSAEGIQRIQIKKDLEKQELSRLSIAEVCWQYGLPYAVECSGQRIRESFEKHDSIIPFSREQVGYAVEDAVAAAKIYPLQIAEAVQKDILSHCITIEMPWVTTNARIEWNGVRVDIEKIKSSVGEITSIGKQCKNILAEQYGIKNVQSHDELYSFFNQAKILNSFKKYGKYCFDKDSLKQNKRLHPVMPIIRAVRQSEDFLSNKIMHPEFIGKDGRIHASHIQLGADTGRQTCRNPNLHGINKIQRPLIIPAKGFGIGEVDYCQMEIGVAAAMFKDENLIKMFNTGDVYSAMAQHFYRDELSEEKLALSGADFKKDYPGHRKKMKVCTLALQRHIK